MGLIKTGLIIGGIVLGLGAAGGITAGVISSQKHSSETIISQDKPSEDIQNDQGSNQATTISIDSVLNSIKQEDIVIKNLSSNEATLKEYYAFDLEDKTLQISETKKQEIGDFDISITVNNKKDSVEKLNNGQLTINIEIKKDQQKASKELELTTFKKADKSLLDLFDQDTTAKTPTKDYSLTLITNKENENNFLKVSELNENEQNLNKLITNSNKEKIENLSLRGKVKLSNISKPNEKATLFTLTSSIDNQYLKLVKKVEGNKTVQALVGSIKTTNLIPDKAFVYIKTENRTESEQFNKTLLDKAKASESPNGFKNTNNNLQIPIKKEGDGNEVSDVNLKTYVIKTEAKDDKIDLVLGIKVVFGNDDKSISFDSSIQQEAKLLKDAGFMFHIYSRWLVNKDEKTADDLNANDLEIGDQKLNKYFVAEKYVTPSEKPNTNSLQGELNAISNNNFFVLGPVGKEIEKPIQIQSRDWMNKNARNYIFFVDYSYVSAGEKTSYSFLNKVLYSPFLTLLNIQKQMQVD